MKKGSFEKALADLENAVEGLERGDLTLEASLRCFEAGVKSLTACQKYLREAENKVELLLKNQDGTMQSVPFEPEDN
ncbi:MAG: exodeoxyribonuclease VII small subunit [Deltaproteobacteria bacterium]|nr:exodeoxyribonuclease VII small subunit [Deltaproteobacteria bacterium]